MGKEITLEKIKMRLQLVLDEHLVNGSVKIDIDEYFAGMVRLQLEGHLYDASKIHSHILDKIISYLIDEDFPKEHLSALLRIVTMFNYSEESEAVIFKFAEELKKYE